MKTTTTTLLLLLSTSSFAYDYTLVNFSSTTPRTEEAILKETNKTRDDLAQYKCSNPERFNLFANTTIQNMKKDSLRLVSKKLGKTFIYIDGAITTEDYKPVTQIKDKFLKIAIKTLKRLETVPESRRLIEELQFAPRPFFVKLGGNRYSPNNPDERTYIHGNEAGFVSFMDELRPMIEQMPFQLIGYGGMILWNPNTDAEFMEADGKMRKVDTDLILAHEMYHAYDGMRGLLDRRFVKSDELEFQPVCEYRAVRMENSLRKSFGYQYRQYYSYSETDSRDMLDDNGEPIILPTPCIEWLN
jgi:hypothetical protein